MTFISTFYSSVLNQIQENSSSIIFWLVLLVLILLLCVLYLIRRISMESSKRALEVADECMRKSDEVGTKVEKLNTYLKEVFRKEFGGAMESFDSTVSAVLNEMKEEMVQSINNIERIESAVKSRRKIDVQVEAGGEKAQALLAEGKATAKTPSKEGAAPKA